MYDLNAPYKRVDKVVPFGVVCLLQLEQCNTVSRSRSIDISNVDVVDLLFNISLSIFHSRRDINIVGEGLQEFGLCWAPTAGWGRYGTTLTVQWWIQEFTYAVIILKNKPLNNFKQGGVQPVPRRWICLCYDTRPRVLWSAQFSHLTSRGH